MASFTYSYCYCVKAVTVGKCYCSSDCEFSVCFGLPSVCFGSIKTPKLAVSVQERNNRNKSFVSDSAETSFGSSFGCFESKVVSKDTLLQTIQISGDSVYDEPFAFFNLSYCAMWQWRLMKLPNPIILREQGDEKINW